MRNFKLFGLSLLVVLVCLVPEGLVYAAAPVIEEFSSEGGRTRNKDNTGDTMYLVRPGDKIIFKVKASSAAKYEWLVNKAVQVAQADTFTWTVPDEKDVWEVHLTVSNKEGEAHAEWVVSTLAESEAPVLVEYFCPDRSQKDPWGRPLPKWESKKKIDLAYCSLHRTAAITPSKTAYGTWVWYRKLGPKSDRGCFAWRIFSTKHKYYYSCVKPMSSGGWDFNVPSKYGKIGVHCMGRSAMGECCSSMADNTDEWDEIRIVRTKDGWWWVWVGEQLWFYSLANENTVREFDSLRFYGRWADCVRVYDRPVWPKKSIRFGDYRDDTTWKKKPSVMREGIVIDGHGVTLKDIAKAINDPKIFRYNPETKTAICFTDLVVKPGAELVIDGETLKMHCDKDGEHQIRVKNCATIRLNKATVTSANQYYFLWAFTSASRWEHYKQWGGFPALDYSGRFLATDSTISNCGNLFIDTPGELILKRCRLLDLVEVDAGNYWKGGYYHAATKRMAGKGKKGLWFYNRKELVDFRIDGCTIHGKDKPIDITFIGGDDLHKVTISNCDIDNIAARRGWRFRDWRRTYYFETEYMSSTIALLNCKFKDLKPQSSKAWIIPKYYLDVLAVDEGGRPIPGAEVRVINEADDAQHPAENLAEKRDWVNRNITYNRWLKVWLDVNNLTAPVPTGKDGHTARPDDKANTLVLTDFVQEQAGRRQFTYTVEVTAPDGRFGQVKGINPGPDWYRKDPNEPVRTIKVVANKPSPTRSAGKDRPKVRMARSPWPTFRGPDHAHTGRSPHTGPAKPRLLWRYNLGAEILASSPVIGLDGTIYMSDSLMHPTLHAVSPDGKCKWRFKEPGEAWSYATPFTFAPSIGRDGTVYAGSLYGDKSSRLRATGPDGKLKWQYAHPDGHAQCNPIEGPDGTIYYGATRRKTGWGYGMYAVSPAGKFKWTRKIEDKGSHRRAHVSIPAFGPDGNLYVSTGQGLGNVSSFKTDGTVKWTYKTAGRAISSPAVSIADKTVYVGNGAGQLLALGFDGSLKWSFKTGAWISSSPSIGPDGTIYFGSRDEYFYAVNKKNGKLKWRFKTGDHIHSSAAIDAAGRIYFGSYDHYFYCLGPDGKLIWKYMTGGSVLSSPAIGADGRLYVGSADGYLYAFGK